MIATRSDARGATRVRDRCERSLGQRRAQRWRRLPPRLGPELVDLDPFEQHRQLVDVDRDARHAPGDASREGKGPALESLCKALRYAKPCDEAPNARCGTNQRLHATM